MQAFNVSVLPFFQWLLKSSLQGSLLICLIFLVKSVLRGRLAIRWYYYLWLLMLVRLATPWVPHSRISVFNLVPEHSWPGRAEVASSTDGAKPEPVNSQQQVQSPTASTGQATAPTTGESTVAFSGGDASTKSVSERLVATLPLAWLIGALGLAGYILARNFGLWRAIKRERPVTDQAILDLLEDCKMQMRVQTIVGVIVTDSVRSPALFGFVRPRLLLPQGLIEALDVEELHHVFLHELAHLKRRDIYLGWLVSLLQVIHWFNPLVWLALRRMRTDQELACDGLVLSTMDADEPAKYGRTIVNLFEKFSQVSYVPSIAGILEDSSQLERRIKMIANPDRKSRAQSIWAVFLLVALGCVALTDARPAHSTVDSLDMKVPASLQGNVLLYLSFDRDGGTRAVDISGMDFHGELHGCEHTEDGRIGGAMRFDGDDDHIGISGVKLHAFTFSAWVKTNTEGLNNRRLFLLDGGEQYYAVQGTSRGDVELTGAGFEEDDPEPIPMREFVVNEWTYVTTTFDGDAFRIYKNGVLARSGRNVHGGLTGTAYLGGTDRYRGGFWHGAMDEVAIFNRALTANEIKQLHTMAGGLIGPLSDTSSTIDDGGQGSARFEGVWTGLAVDKPGYGTSTDSLTLELNVDESGRLAGIATGNFVNSGYCRLKNVEVSGNRITFEVRHRFQNRRMGVTLELTDGTLQGEGVPIDVDDDHCDITLRRRPYSAFRPAGGTASEIARENMQGAARFTGVWTGLAVDKPGYGTSRDSLTLELSADESGRLAGIAAGDFVNSGYCRLKNVEVSGNRITFEVRHRFQNRRMGVTLELKDGALHGEGVPIDVDDDHCDITLRRDSGHRPVLRPRPAPRRSGPVLHYSFNGSRGVVVTDESGQGHHGKVHGASYTSNGRVGGAMSFDGNDDCISTSDISLREFTFSAWVKTHTGGLNNRRIFLLSDGKNCYALQCNVGGSVGIYIADDVEVNEYDWSFEFGRWTHVTVTHDGNTFKIYRDGRLTETGHIETSGVMGTLYIGGTDRHRGGFWHGMIDELFLFDRALSDSEVERLYGPATGVGNVSLSARRTDEPVTTGEYAPGSRFEGVWSGMAADKPGDGTSRDSLKLELKVGESGGLAGTASGEFVKDGRCELKNLKISGSRISFEVAHRIANLRMGVTLELEDGTLKGEASPIDFDENSCDIVLRRESSR